MWKAPISPAAFLLSSSLMNAAITTVTTLSVTPVAPSFGQTITLTAMVSPPSAPGFVSFLDNGVLVGTGAVNGSGIAQAKTLTLTAGPHSLVAAYGGNTSAGYLASQSAALPYIVTAFSGSNFAAAVNYGTGPQPFSVVVGDFNGVNPTRFRLRRRHRRSDHGMPGGGGDSGARRTGFRGERENDSGVRANRIPG